MWSIKVRLQIEFLHVKALCRVIIVIMLKIQMHRIQLTKAVPLNSALLPF